MRTCKDKGLLTVHDGGRLGNKMSQYATLLAHANRLGAQPVISTNLDEDLRKHFPNLRYVILTGLSHKIGIAKF